MPNVCSCTTAFTYPVSSKILVVCWMLFVYTSWWCCITNAFPSLCSHLIAFEHCLLNLPNNESSWSSAVEHCDSVWWEISSWISSDFRRMLIQHCWCLVRAKLQFAKLESVKRRALEKTSNKEFINYISLSLFLRLQTRSSEQFTWFNNPSRKERNRWEGSKMLEK